jgi:hypothetical protein
MRQVIPNHHFILESLSPEVAATIRTFLSKNLIICATSVPDRCEGSLKRISGADALPMLC